MSGAWRICAGLRTLLYDRFRRRSGRAALSGLGNSGSVGARPGVISRSDILALPQRCFRLGVVSTESLSCKYFKSVSPRLPAKDSKSDNDPMQFVACAFCRGAGVSPALLRCVEDPQNCRRDAGATKPWQKLWLNCIASGG